MNRDLLSRAFEPHQIKTRPGMHGRTLSYVDVTAVIRRLNEGCDNWSFEVVEHHVHEGEVVVLGKLTADGVVKSAFGGSTITIDKTGAVVSIADDLKAASSDSLKKAASLLGVALEHYGGAPDVDPAAAASTTASPSERVTTRQLAAIHGAARKHGLSKERLANVVRSLSGKEQLTELSRSEASSVISELTSANGNGR